MILIQDKIVDLSFSFERRYPIGGSLPRIDIYRGSAQIGYWNTHSVGQRLEVRDGKPITSRASLYVKRGRYSPKNCFHFRNSETTLHLVSSTLTTVNEDTGLHYGGSLGMWEGTGQHAGESLLGHSNLIWFIDRDSLVIVYSYGFPSGSKTPGSGYRGWRVTGPNVSLYNSDWWDDGGAHASDVAAMEEWGRSLTGSVAIPLSESPDFIYKEVKEDQLDLDYVLDTVGAQLEASFAEVEATLPIPDVLDEALGSWLGPDISWLETLIPLKDLGDFAKNMITVPKTVKELAGYFLGVKYGIIPWPGTIRDLETMVKKVLTEAIRKNHPVKLSAGKHVVSDFYECDVRATVRARVANAAVLTAARLGVGDPLTEVWNCVPYSFVVDWFADLGGAIGRLEKRAQWASLELSEILTSYRIRIDLSHYEMGFRRLGIAAQGYAVLYRRVYHDSLPAPNYFQLPDIAGNIRRHWAEGLALVIQRV